MPPLTYALPIIQRRLLVVRDAIDAGRTPGYIQFSAKDFAGFELRLYFKRPCAQLDGAQLVFDCPLWSDDPTAEVDLADNVSIFDGDGREVILSAHLKFPDPHVRPGKPILLEAYVLSTY